MTDSVKPPVISEDDCPFTEDELRRALELAYDAADAAREARRIAESARTQHTRARAEAAIARGSRDPEEINPEYLILPDGWFALLVSLGPEQARRFDEWRRTNRAAARPGRERNAMYAAGHHPLTPVTALIAARLDAEDAEADAHWERLLAHTHEWLRVHAMDPGPKPRLKAE